MSVLACLWLAMDFWFFVSLEIFIYLWYIYFLKTGEIYKNNISFFFLCLFIFFFWNPKFIYLFLTFFLLLFNKIAVFCLFPPPLPTRPCYWTCVLYNCSCKPFTVFPHYPLPFPLWSLSACSQFQCLWLYFACLFVFLMRFQLKVRSYAVFAHHLLPYFT